MNPPTPTTDSNVSLRPRIRRLVSLGEDGQKHLTSPSVDSRHASSPASTSRAVSPMPPAHPSRTTTPVRPPWSDSTTTRRDVNASKKASTNSLFSPEYWETSWSSIQGFASTLLGNEARNGERPYPTPKGAGAGAGQSSRYGARPNAHSWGPQSSLLANGFDEDRAAKVQARKREALLNANQHLAPDTSGKLKRRTSVDQSFAPDADSLDPLVYVYPVQAGDTLAGVAIKFNCSQAAFRKTNRLWPNDSIQVRRHAFLPVDACGVRGRKTAGAEATSGNVVEGRRASPWVEETQPQDWSIPADSDKATAPNVPANHHKTSPDFLESSSWIHDSWVRIEGFPDPVEIARLPRRCLGFFPPARRKSGTRTRNSSTSIKSSSPPTTSPGRDRDTMLPSAPTPGHHVLQSSAFPSPRSSVSHSHASTAAAAALFMSTLQGPGGVGTLGREAKGPGPAPDKLNEILAPHLPSMAPPTSSLSHASVASLQASELRAPRASFESVGSAGSLEALGGKVERWARRMAAGKKAPADAQGDLIELVEGWDAGGGMGVNTDRAGEPGEPAERRRVRERHRDGSTRSRPEDGGYMDEQTLAERFGVPTGGKVFTQRH